MPSVIGSGKTRRIIYDADDALGGLVPQFGGGAEPKLDILGKLSDATAFNPYRRLGSFAPGYNPQDPTNYASLGAYLKKGVVDSSNIYATADTDEIHKITIGVTPAVVDDATWPHDITPHGGATTPVADDAVIYTGDQTGTDVRALYYSWSDDTSWDVGMYNLSATFDDDWMTTAPVATLGTPYTTGGQGKAHPLEIGEDDVLYMGDRRFLHEYDGGVGTDGTVTEEVLKIPKGMEMRSLAKFPQFMVAFAYRASTTAGASYYQGECKAYFWDYLSSEPSYIFDLNDNYVGEAFVYNGTVGVFTQGRTNDLENNGFRASKMQLFRGFGVGFTPELTFDDDIPERGGVFVNDNVIHWNSEANHYTYGSPFKTGRSSLNKIAQGASSNAVSGMLMNPSTNFYLMSPSSGSDSRLKYFKSGNYAENTIWSGVNATPTFAEGMKGQIKAVEVFFDRPATGGRAMTLTLIDQAQNTEVVVSALTAVTSSSMVKEYKDQAKRPTFTTIKPYVSYATGSGQGDAPVIQRIEIYFEEVNIKNP